jgi:hypothetical protein
MTKHTNTIRKRRWTEKSLVKFIGDDLPVPPRWNQVGVLMIQKANTMYRFVKKEEMWVMYEKHKVI